MAAYRVVTLDLSVAADRQSIAPANTAIDSLTVLRYEGGGTSPAELALGSGEFFPVYAGLGLDLCPPELDGVFFRNSTPGIGTLVVLLSFGGVSARTV